MVGVQLDPGNSLSCRYFWLGADDVARVIRPDLSAVEGPVRAKKSRIEHSVYPLVAG